jgi:cysteine-rich repeat protein
VELTDFGSLVLVTVLAFGCGDEDGSLAGGGGGGSDGDGATEGETTDGATDGATTSDTAPETTSTSTGDDTTTSADDTTSTTDSTTSSDDQTGTCGDGVVDAGEECDEGPANADDGACTSECKNAVCGDGLVHAGVEQCDDGNSSNTDDCLNACVPASCGDSHTWDGVEECDDGNDSNDDACTVDCTVPTCGDGYLHKGLGEFCDDGNDIDGDSCNNDCLTAGLWTKTYNGAADNDDSGFAIAADSTGDIIVVGSTYVVNDADDVWVRKLDPDGNTVWTRTYHGITADDGYGVAVDSTDAFVVVGSTYTSTNGRDVWVRKYTSGGNEDWTRTYNGPADSSDEAFGVAIDGSDGIVVAGYETTNAQGRDIWVRKYNAAGTEQWTETHNGTANDRDEAQAVAIDGSGTVYVAGWEYISGEGRNVWVRQYSAGGVAGWTQTYNGPDDANDEGWGVATDSGGNVIVIGFTPVAGQENDVWIRKYDGAGAELWTRTHSGRSERNDFGRAVTTDSADAVIVAGSEYLAGGAQDNIWVRKYDADGNELWNSEYWGPAGQTDSGRGVAVDGNDNVIVTGYETRTDIGEMRNIWIRKYLP